MPHIRGWRVGVGCIVQAIYSEVTRLDHTARHKAANSGTPILVVGPNNRPPKTVGHLDDGGIRNVDPFVLQKDLEVSGLTSPIGIVQQVAVRKGAAGLSPIGL